MTQKEKKLIVKKEGMKEKKRSEVSFIAAVRLKLSGTPRQSASLKHTCTLLYITWVVVNTAKTALQWILMYGTS